jgi:hypothetical protein
MSKESKHSVKDAFAGYLKDPEGKGAEKLLACLENYRSAWQANRTQHWDKVWANNIKFYSGKHYVRDVAANRTSSYRVLIKENHVNNIVQRMVSIFQQNMPITKVFPNSISWDDVENAKNTEEYIKYFWRVQKLEKKLAKYLKYAAVTGNAFAFHQWNPDRGGKMIIGQAETESGESEVAEYRGDPELFIEDPFRYNVRPGIDELDDMYDIIRSVPACKSQLEAVHGEIKAEGASIQNVSTGETREDDDVVIQHHYFHKPTPWFEEGIYATWVEGKLLKAVSYPKEYCDRLPVTHLPFDKAPMSFWGISSVEQVMDLQEQLNRAASMIVEARNLVARPRVLVSNEAKMPAQSLSDRPGEILRYAAAGGPPKFEVPPFNFAEMQAHKADLRTALSLVSGVTTASRGEIPANARTALALQLILEQDRSQFLPFIKAFHQCILDINYGLLNVVAANIDEDDPREIKIEGKDRGTRLFHGGMVPSPLDLYLEDTNPLGWTAGSRIESAMELVKYGVEKDPNRVKEMLGMASTDPAYEFLNINRQCQQREFLDLNKGQIVEIGPEDDDHIHLEEITKVMASYEFKSRPEIVRLAYEHHARQHKERLAQGMQGAPMPQGAAPKVPGGMDPQGMAQQTAAPVPGQNMDELLTSARAG